MKNHKTHWMIIALTVVVVSLAATLTSCGPFGGTIIVDNQKTDNILVNIYSDAQSIGAGMYTGSEKIYDSVFIPAGENKSFLVEFDSTYLIDTFANGERTQKLQKVMNGDIVVVEIF